MVVAGIQRVRMDSMDKIYFRNDAEIHGLRCVRAVAVVPFSAMSGVICLFGMLNETQSRKVPSHDFF